MTKDVVAAILERRSVRRFSERSIPEVTIGRLLDAARFAPSAGNIQPWHFYVVINKDKQEKLRNAALGQPAVSQAAAVIVVCAIPGLAQKRYGERGEKLYCLQDTAAAVENILLAATGYGLGSCWIGAFEEKRVRQALDMPVEHLPVAMVALGYPDREAKSPVKKPLDEITTIIR